MVRGKVRSCEEVWTDLSELSRPAPTPYTEESQRGVEQSGSSSGS